MISFTYQLKTPFDTINELLTKSWIKAVVNNENKKVGDIQYIICDDRMLNQINVKFLNHDTFTDIITFPTTENKEVVSGEIYISIDRVFENSKKHDTTYKNEFNRVIVHGVLHLLGYNDSTPTEKKQMRSKEDYYLNLQS